MTTLRQGANSTELVRVAQPQRAHSKLPPPVKAARAIARALDDLGPEERAEALTLALPLSEPTSRLARLEMAIEAALIVVKGSYNSEANTAAAILRTAQK